MPPHARRRCSAACTPPHLCCSMHATAFTPLSRRRIDAVALTLQHLCQRSDAAEFMRTSHAAAFFGRSISSRISRCRILPSHLRCSSRTAAFTLQLWGEALCRWKRTTRSAISNAEHDADGRERFLKRGVLGWGGGWVGGWVGGAF